MSNEKMSSKIIEYAKNEIDWKYYLGFAIGTIALVLVIILTASLGGNFVQVIFYPMLIFFIFQQFLAGFGFITGYIPIAQAIIKFLTKSAGKKEYNEKEINEIDRRCEELDQEEKEARLYFEKKLKENQKEKLRILEKKENGMWSDRRCARKLQRITNQGKKIEEKRDETFKEIEEEKKQLKKQKKKTRSKIEETLLTKQEEMDPRRFKFILLVPLYVMVGVGGYIAISAIIKGIIIAVQGVDTTSLVVRVIDKIDLVVVNEYYKGIIISVVIVIFYILPSIKLLKDPEAQIGPQRLDGRRRKISDWWKRRVTKDYRTLINRQFEDLRKHYWDIKQIIAKALLIPIGLAQLIVAPIGGMAVVMGIKTSVQRKKLEKYELVIQIIIGVALIGLLLASSFTLVARQIRSLPAVMIISKLLYGLALIFSFYTFTRMPIAQTDKI